MRKIVLFLGFLFVVLVGWAQKPQLIILHTNDTHCQIEPYNKKGDTLGGVLRRNEVIEEYRKENPDRLLLLDAGDFSQGTPYFNFFEGVAEINLMNKMGYDAATLGNHEFDNGEKALGKRLKKARFEIVCANYTFSDKNLKKIVKPYTVIEKNGLKIGIFGLTVNFEGLLSPHLVEGVKFEDPILVAEKIVKQLRENEKCDLVICLSHLGFSPEQENAASDTLLARKINGIDIIIGGHTHKYLAQPVIVNKTQILQLEDKGIHIGKLEIYDTKEK